MSQMIFKRYELKYSLSRRQKELILRAMEPYMSLDEYGHSTIRNIYFDTDSFRLIRHSIERPAYKEKLRVRSYKQVNEQEPVFVELKKKYKSVVYKRRLTMSRQTSEDWLCGRIPLPMHTQIAEEIEYFRNYYETLHPAVFLSYEREAFYSHCGDDFRVTFDENILARTEELSLGADVWGNSVIDNDTVLMEIKTSGGIPLWMTHFLTEQRIYKTSFSKYGTAYKNFIANSNGNLRIPNIENCGHCSAMEQFV
jgi:hypothetical protein